jgi:hypothetical protein
MSIETIERVCLEVQNLLTKVQATLGRVRDMVVPDTTSATIALKIKDMAVNGGTRRIGDNHVPHAPECRLHLGQQILNFQVDTLDGFDAHFQAGIVRHRAASSIQIGGS